MKGMTQKNEATQSQQSQSSTPPGSFPMRTPNSSPMIPQKSSIRLFSLDDEDEDEEIFTQIRAIKNPGVRNLIGQKPLTQVNQEENLDRNKKKQEEIKLNMPNVLAPELPRTQEKRSSKVPLQDLTVIDSSDEQSVSSDEELDSDSPAIQQISSDDEPPSVKKRKITQQTESITASQSTQFTQSQVSASQWSSQIPSSQQPVNSKKPKQMNLSQFWKGIPAPEVTESDKKAKDKWNPTIVKIPPKISMALARTIRNYRDPATQCKRSSYWEGHLENFQFKPEGNRWAAILLDPPWGQGHGQITPKALQALNFHQLITNGFIFIWIEKELTMEIAEICTAWGFKYVENVVWMKQRIDFEPHIESSTYFNKRKMTLHIWRKGGKDLDLRHQRNPDIVFDVRFRISAS